jgi:hypothetical protein
LIKNRGYVVGKISSEQSGIAYGQDLEVTLKDGPSQVVYHGEEAEMSDHETETSDQQYRWTVQIRQNLSAREILSAYFRELQG